MPRCGRRGIELKRRQRRADSSRNNGRKSVEFVETSVREEILESAARALFVSSFADACEALNSSDPQDIEWRESLAPADIERLENQSASCGADWMDTVSDEIPKEAIACAAEIVAEF